jgi:hypothetical protein
MSTTIEPALVSFYVIFTTWLLGLSLRLDNIDKKTTLKLTYVYAVSFIAILYGLFLFQVNMIHSIVVVVLAFTIPAFIRAKLEREVEEKEVKDAI